MDLGTPRSAIVFNALLVPIALRGVRYRAVGATALLRRNLLVYGVGGLIAPLIGIQLIDLVVHGLLGAWPAARRRSSWPDRAATRPIRGRRWPRRSRARSRG